MNRRSDSSAGPRLASFLSRIGGRLRRRRALEAALASLPWSLTAAALLLGSLRLASTRGWLELDTARLLPLAGALVLIVAAGRGLVAATRRFARQELALLADHELGTQETIATATWLTDSDERAERALEAIGERGASEAVPGRSLPWTGALVGLAVLALAALLPLPGAGPPPPPAKPDPVVQAAATEVEEKAKELAEEMEEREAPESVQRLFEEIQQQASMLQRATTSRDEAALALQSLEQKVQEERERRQAADSGALERALSAMERSALTRRAARAAQAGDAQALEQELASLAEAFREGVSFDEREIDRLSVRLQEAADELRESGHDELADRLEELARALEEGDSEAAAKLFEELLDSGLLEQAGNDAAANEALAEAQAMLQQALAQMGRARPDQLTPDPTQTAVEALTAQAEKLEEAGAGELAEQLREIAEALEAGDLDRAEQMTEEMLSSGECKKPTGTGEGDAAAKEAEELLAQVLAGIREAKEGQAGGSGGAGQGGMAWRGQRTRGGSPIIPKDWGTGSTNEATAGAQMGGPGHQSDRQAKETSDWVEAYEALYDSTRLEDAEGRRTRVKGMIGEGEHVAVPVWTTAGGPDDPQLPLVSLPPSYKQASEEALATETIPAGYKESVRRYFESLGGSEETETKGDDE